LISTSNQHINLAEGRTHLRPKPVDFDDLAHVWMKRSGAVAGLSGYLHYLSTYFPVAAISDNHARGCIAEHRSRRSTHANDGSPPRDHNTLFSQALDCTLSD